MESFLAVLALIGAVIVVSALLSGWVDRTGVPQVARRGGWPDARALVGGYDALKTAGLAAPGTNP